jgi:tRNA 2-thiouridine synthesizing protein A
MDDVDPPPGAPADPAVGAQIDDVDPPGDEAALTVDARGLRCPMPVIRLAQAARTVPPGTLITVLSTDPAAEPDLAAWCRMRGATLHRQEWVESTPRFLRSDVLTPA